MNMRKVFSLITATAIVAAFMVIAVAEANAQQGRYANRYSKRDVSSIINRLETSSDEFSRDFKQAMNNSRRNGRAAEERFNNVVEDFENSVDRLRRQFDRNDSWWESRNEVQNMVRDSRPVNTMMTTISFRRNLERQWNRLRTDINTVADTFDLPGLNGGGWNGGGGGNSGGGNQAGNPPSWAVGRFYGRDPYGMAITLTVDRNGRVIAEVNGSPSYGTMNGSNLEMGGDRARVTRLNNGIRTRGRNGVTIDYFRTFQGPGPGGVGNAPTWARGTFYGRNPNGGTITLTIGNNGSVTADFGDGNRNYGTLNGEILTINGESSRVTRRGNGIRTTNTANGMYIDYNRNRR
jgi:hypothetical protein